MSRLGLLRTTEEKEGFVKDLMGSLQESILRAIRNSPEGWDGCELRWFIADYVFNMAVFGEIGKRKGSRYRAYKNDLLVNNLS